MTETSETTETSGGVRIGGILGILGLVAAVSVGAIALGSSTPAGAEGLERFASCEELDGWVTSVSPPTTVMTDFEGAGRAADGATSSAAGGAEASAPAPVAADEALAA